VSLGLGGLADSMGFPEVAVSRHAFSLAKKLWVYIKKHKLQDQKNKRMINADDVLKDVFKGKKQVSMFEMTALVSKHLS